MPTSDETDTSKAPLLSAVPSPNTLSPALTTIFAPFSAVPLITLSLSFTGYTTGASGAVSSFTVTFVSTLTFPALIFSCDD